MARKRRIELIGGPVDGELIADCRQRHVVWIGVDTLHVYERVGLVDDLADGGERDVLCHWAVFRLPESRNRPEGL